MLPSSTLALAEDLSGKLPDAFARTVLSGSLGAAWDSANPIRANLFAAGFRELVSYVLHHLAPDEMVITCGWYEIEKNIPSKKLQSGHHVTRVQRMVYATQGGLPDDFLESIGVDVDDDHRKFRTIIDDLSKYTHVRPGSLIEGDSGVSTFMNDALGALVRFFNILSEVRDTIAEAVSESVNEAADAALTDTVVQELDELSTHTTVEEVVADDISVEEIGPKLIKFNVSGTVYVRLNYGSRSDFNRGDGASLPDKYPFSVKMAASVDDLQPYTLNRVSVDNSSFYR